MAFKAAGLAKAEFLIAAGGRGRDHVGVAGHAARLGPHPDGDGPRRATAEGLFGHPSTFKTPWKATVVVGLGIAVMAGLFPIEDLVQMTNIGTLFAFAVVCMAVLDPAWD